MTVTKPALTARPMTCRDAPPAPLDQLLLSATELFVAGTPHTVRERQIYSELAENTLRQSCVKDRRKIASLLVRCPEAPASILSRLASDCDALTAASVLAHAETLPHDLMEKTLTNGPERLRRAVALRPDLPEKLHDLVAGQCSSETLELFLSQTDAALDDSFTHIICTRPEVFKSVSATLEARHALSATQMMNRFCDLEPVVRGKAIAAAELANLARTMRTGARSPARSSFKKSLLDALAKSALVSSPAQFAAELGYALGLPEDMSRTMVLHDSGEALSVCLKALGIETDIATGMLIRLLGQRLDLRALRPLVRLHASLSGGAALLLVRHWNGTAEREQLRPSRIPQHQPLHQESQRPNRGTGAQEAVWKELDAIEQLLKIG